MVKMSRVISILLVLATILSFKVNVIAQQVNTEGDFLYYEDSGEIILTRYNGTDSTVTIPSTISGKPVTTISHGTFVDNYNVKTIIIPEFVKSIDESAFQYLLYLSAFQVDTNNKYFSGKDGVLYNKDKTSLVRCPETKENMILPGTLTRIEEYAFNTCRNITTLNIPDSVTSIGAGAFYRCINLQQIKLPGNLTKITASILSECRSLQELIIPDTVMSIDQYAFTESGLKSIKLPNNLKELASDALSNCTSLKTIDISDNNQYFSSLDGILFNKNKTVIINFPAGKELNQYIIPGSVTEIKANTFFGNAYLSAISIPNTVKIIGENAFNNCTQLSKVNIPEGVSTIEPFTFGRCVSLPEIELPDSLTAIRWAAFADSGLKTVFIKKGIKSIENYAFCCKIESIEVDDSNAYFTSKDGVLFNKAFTEILIYPNGKSNQIYSIPEGITTINGAAFEYSNKLVTVNMPGSLKTISENAFSGCQNLEKVTIPEGVTCLTRAFQRCKKLTKVILPSSMAVIDPETFNSSDQVSISGYSDTFAETYAKQKGFVFVPIIAKAIMSSLVINGQITKIKAYNINGFTYFKVRDLAMLLNKTEKQFNVYWDSYDKSVNITTSCEYTPVGGELVMPAILTSSEPKLTTSSIYVDGAKCIFTTYIINNNTYFKLRDIGKVIDFSISYDGKIQIDTSRPYVE